MLDKLLDFLVSVLKIFQFWVVIYPYERGVLLRLGKFKRVLENGLHFCLPGKIDRALVINIVPRTIRLGAQSLVTGDGKVVVVNTVVTCEINDPVKALLEVHSVEHVIDDVCSGLVAAFVAGNPLNYLIECCADPDFELLEECCEHTAELGINVIKIQFTDVSPSRTLRLLHSTTEAASFWGSTDENKDKL